VAKHHFIMKNISLIILGLLVTQHLFSQRMGAANRQMTREKHLPFYKKEGNREIYHLYISDTIVNYTGHSRPAMAVNGSIPAPSLEFTEGDTAEIYVTNEMAMESSIHWHGVILPNRYDGVSYLTTSPIEPGETHLYKFKLVQHGTMFYHSHTMNQQQNGLYGAFIVHERNESPQKQYTLVLSDWTDENPNEVERSLHNETEWYGIKKGSTQNYAEAISKGYFKTKLANEWKRMVAMDVSDVYYNRFLSNGEKERKATGFKAGDQVRLHIVNGSSSTYFWLSFAGGKLSVIANDGASVEPVKVDRMIIAVAETYDVVVTIPKDGDYEFLATAEDRTGSTSLWLGDGTKVSAAPLGKLNYFEGMKMMNKMMGGHKMSMGGMKMSDQKMDMNAVMYPENTGAGSKATTMPAGKMPVMDMDEMGGMDMAGMDRGSKPAAKKVTLNYGMLRATKKTTLPPGPLKLLRFDLTGNMNRYVWTINNKTVSEADKILIKDGENVRIILHNKTMMRHPMHLHGHYFRVLNGQGDYAPLKNTLDIMPMETDTLEFAANASGDWFFHCHILYHMMSGMGRIFSYENSPPNPDIPDPATSIKKVYADDRRFFAGAEVSLESNGSDGNIGIVNTRWRVQSIWELGLNDKKGYESETTVGRFLGESQWSYVYGGFDYHYKKSDGAEKNLFGQVTDKDNLHTAVAGFAYILPMLVIADARIDANGKFRVQLGRNDVPLTSRLRFSFDVNTDKEYNTGLKYIVTKYVAISTHYDSDMGWGAGLTALY
jgi:CopA family copper-resistance protein